MLLTDFLLARIAEEERFIEAGRRPDVPDEEFNSWGWVRRSIAECEAKRRIVELAQSGGTYADDLQEEALLKALALPYADHPEYRDYWRP